MISTSPTLREIITEVFRTYDSSKTFKDCQTYASNKYFFSPTNPINSMKSWSGYAEVYKLIINIDLRGAIYQGHSEFDARVIINIEDTVINEKLSNYFTKRNNHTDSLGYFIEIETPVANPLFYTFSIGNILIDDSPLMIGKVQGMNPFTPGDIFYTYSDGAGYTSSDVQNNQIDITKPFSVDIYDDNTRKSNICFESEAKYNEANLEYCKTRIPFSEFKYISNNKENE